MPSLSIISPSVSLGRSTGAQPPLKCHHAKFALCYLQQLSRLRSAQTLLPCRYSPAEYKIRLHLSQMLDLEKQTIYAEVEGRSGRLRCVPQSETPLTTRFLIVGCKLTLYATSRILSLSPNHNLLRAAPLEACLWEFVGISLLLGSGYRYRVTVEWRDEYLGEISCSSQPNFVLILPPARACR